MSDYDKLEEFFSHKTWAVAGDVLNPSKYAHRILEKFKAREYTVVGINPRKKSGEVYKALSEVKEPIEALDLCINPIQGLEIVKEAKKIGITRILIQPGAESEEILEFCKNNGIIAVEGCALVYFSTH